MARGDAALAKDNEIEIGVQVNGKLRDTIKLERDSPNDAANHWRWHQLPSNDIWMVKHPKRSLLSKIGLLMWWHKLKFTWCVVLFLCVAGCSAVNISHLNETVGTKVIGICCRN